MNTIDCRKMACPAPVISVKKALETLREIRVLLDYGAPCENVARFAGNRGFIVQEERGDDGCVLTITAGTSVEIKSTSSSKSGDVVFLITSDRLGDGPDELGRLLMKNLIHSLLEARDLP